MDWSGDITLKFSSRYYVILERRHLGIVHMTFQTPQSNHSNINISILFSRTQLFLKGCVFTIPTPCHQPNKIFHSPLPYVIFNNSITLYLLQKIKSVGLPLHLHLGQYILFPRCEAIPSVLPAPILLPREVFANLLLRHE